MAKKSSNFRSVPSQEVMEVVGLGTGTTYVSGGNVIWDVDEVSVAATTVVILENFDRSQYGDFGPWNKPHIIVKCSCNTSLYNVEIQRMDGTVLYTFAADYSSTPIFCVFNLTAARAWQVAA